MHRDIQLAPFILDLHAFLGSQAVALHNHELTVRVWFWQPGLDGEVRWGTLASRVGGESLATGDGRRELGFGSQDWMARFGGEH